MTKATKWHPPSLIRVFAVCMKKAWILSYPLRAQRRLWSDWANAQADLNLCWARMPFHWFCHEVAILTHICLVDSSILTNWTNSFQIYGCLVYFLCSNFEKVWSLLFLACPCVSACAGIILSMPSVTLWTIHARVLKFYIWIPLYMEKWLTCIFFLSELCPFLMESEMEILFARYLKNYLSWLGLRSRLPD